MRHRNALHIAAVGFAVSMGGAASAVPFTIGAAPPGDAKKVAEKIIKYNFPMCKKMGAATRKPDGSIKATCSDAEFLVFTVFNPKEGRALELALNCSAAKKHKISC